MKTLLLNLYTTSRASYYDDWQDAFVTSTHFKPLTIKHINKIRDVNFLKKHIADYDLIILLHACCADTPQYIDKLKPILCDRKGKLLTFIGNEYNVPSNPLSARINILKAISPNYVATQLPLATGEWLYESVTTAKVISMPHALNPKVFSPGLKSCDRPLDFGVRTFKYPPYLGDRDRNIVTDLVCNKALEQGYQVDLSYTSRLSRKNWAQFLQQSKFTVTTEAGSDYISPNDDLVLKISKFIQQKTQSTTISANSSLLRYCARFLPFQAKALIRNILKRGNVVFSDDSSQVNDALYTEIEEKFFKHTAKSPFSGKCISSRHLDAIGTQTAQILLEGSFNGMLKPYEHYIPIKKEFSNLDEVFTLASDTSFVEKMIKCAYEHIRESHTYKDRIAALYGALQ